ncbi:hypothetical protein AB3S75_032989 [Citrus x aurantiifolia]
MPAASIAVTSYTTLSSGKRAPKDEDVAVLDRKYMLELLLPLLLS